MNYNNILIESSKGLDSIVFYDVITKTALWIYVSNKTYKVTSITKDVESRGEKVSFNALNNINRIIDSLKFKRIQRSNRVSDIDMKPDDDMRLESPQELNMENNSDFNFNKEGDL